MSPLRSECIAFIEDWVYQLPPSVASRRVLDIGIAGDPKPGQNYYLFKEEDYETSDVDARYEPTYVFDVCAPPLELRGKFDVVILSNTLEHIYEKHRAIKGCHWLLKHGGTLIIDCPWMYPYHAEDGFEDYWRISASALKRLLCDAGFLDVETKQGQWCTSGRAMK